MKSNAPRVRWRGRLIFKYRLHARLRAWVYARDDFTCQTCGFKPMTIPDPYDGRYTVGDRNGMLVLDHILCLKHGGDNSPENLQTLCDPCNARKVNTHDIPNGLVIHAQQR